MTQFLLTNFGEARLTWPVDDEETVLHIDPLYADRFPSPVGDQAFALILWDGTHPQEIMYCWENTLNGELVVTRAEESTTPRNWLAGTQVRHFLTAETAGSIFQSGFLIDHAATQQEAEEGAVDDKIMSPLNTSQFWNVRTTEFSEDFLLADSQVEARQILGWETAVLSGTGIDTVFTLPKPEYDAPYTKVYVNEVYQSSGYDINGALITFVTPPPLGVDNIVVVLGDNFAFSISFPGNNTVGTPALVDGAVTQPKIADSAVSSIKIQAGAVSYAKIQQISATDRLLGRFSPGAGNIEEIFISDQMQNFLSATSVPGFQAALSDSIWPVPVGMLAFFLHSGVPTGWIQAIGGSIGNGGSGANNRANLDTMNLFAHIWTVTAAADYPIYSPGTLTVVARQATWNLDWDANRHLTVPDMRGNFPRGHDYGTGINGMGLGSFRDHAMKNHYHGLLMNALAPHQHSYGPAQGRYGMNDASPGSFRPSVGDSNGASYSLTVTAVSAGTPGGLTDWSGAPAGPDETRPRHRTFLPFIKL